MTNGGDAFAVEELSCRSCGAHLSTTAKFCSECGARGRIGCRLC